MEAHETALTRLLDIVEHQYKSMSQLAEALPGAFLSASIARETIAHRCEKTVKLIEEKM